MGILSRSASVDEYLTFYRDDKSHEQPYFVAKAYRELNDTFATLATADDANVNDAVIAGGVFQSILANQAPRDIDIFTNQRAFNLTVLAFAQNGYMGGPEYGYSGRRNSAKAVRLFRASRPDINIINVVDSAAPEVILNSFDFTVCSCAATREYMVWHPFFEEDSLNRRLRFAHLDQNPYKTLMRYNKYVRKGFEPDREDLKDLATFLWGLDAINDEDFQEPISASVSGTTPPPIAWGS